MEGPSKYAVSEDDARRTSTFYHTMLYRRHPAIHPDQGETVALRRLDKKFGLDSKNVVFNTKTFCEEFFAHMIAVIIGPFSMPLVYLLSGWKGGVITGFLPGKIQYGGEKPYSNNSVFYIQIFVWATHWLPIYIAAGYFLSGQIVTNRMLTPWLDNDMKGITGTNSTNNITSDVSTAPSGNVSATWTDISFMDMVVLPFLVLMVRQYVIAVKYAFIARGRIRSHRKKGRNMLRWEDERLNAFYLDPSREMAMLSLEKAAWRAGIGDLEHIYLEFVDPVSSEDQERMDLAETNKGRALENSSKSSSKSSSSSKNSSDLEVGKKVYQDTKSISLQMFTKYVTISGIEYFSNLPGGRATPSGNMMFLFAGLVAFIPPLFRLLHERPAFGETHLDKYFAATQFINMFSPFGFGAALFLFPACLKIHFDRHRYFMHHYMELLIPVTVPDAREIDTFLPPSTLFDGLPDLKPTARNVYNWNLGRHVMRKYALYFRRRMEFFVGLYIILLAIMCIYEFVSMIVVLNSGGSLRVTAALIIELYLAVVLCVGGLLIIRTGMRANRQIKLHKSVVEHYRTRLEAHVENQVEVMKMEGVDQTAIAVRVAEVKSLQRALKHIANEMDAEGDNEKLRINGFPVDSRMAEAILTLLGSVAITIYNAFFGNVGVGV